MSSVVIYTNQRNISKSRSTIENSWAPFPPFFLFLSLSLARGIVHPPCQRISSAKASSKQEADASRTFQKPSPELREGWREERSTTPPSFGCSSPATYTTATATPGHHRQHQHQHHIPHSPPYHTWRSTSLSPRVTQGEGARGGTNPWASPFRRAQGGVAFGEACTQRNIGSNSNNGGRGGSGAVARNATVCCECCNGDAAGKIRVS